MPVLATPTLRSSERAAVTTGATTPAVPVSTPAAHAPNAELLLALLALAASGLIDCIQHAYGQSLKPGYYSLETMILETVLRTLAGEPWTEGATRIDPVAFGHILGLDRAPEAAAIRRKHQELAQQEKAGQLLEALGCHHLEHLTPSEENNPLGLLLYVDGHVCSYQGTGRSANSFRRG